jgi:hypothetical protein
MLTCKGARTMNKGKDMIEKVEIITVEGTDKINLLNLTRIHSLLF